MRWIVTALVLGVLAFGAGPAVGMDRSEPEGVVWSGIRFTDKAAFAKWLDQHGVTYAAWARRHPLGAYLMTHPPAPSLTAAGRSGPSPVAGPVASTAGGRSKMLVLVFAALAAVLLAVGAVGGRLARVAQVPLDWEQVSMLRFGTSAAGAALAAGAVLAWLL